MKALLLLACVAVASVAVSTAFSDSDSLGTNLCPKYCSCSQRGFNGGIARCTKLDKTEQTFSQEINHLIVENLPQEGNGLELGPKFFLELGLGHVETIRITNSSVQKIDRHAFQGLKGLYHVDLSDNKIILIHPDTFKDNPALRQLSLAGNHLQLTQVLHSEVPYFLVSNSLLELILSRCELSQLAPSTFSKLRNLDVLDLSHNYLQHLTKSMFSGTEMNEINLSYNQISSIAPDTFEDMEDMASLSLRGNPITTIEGVQLPDLMDLDLSYCQITELTSTMLEGAPQVSHLNLSHNAIQDIDKDAFTYLSALKYLDLSYNDIKGPLPIFLFELNQELETLSLAGNRHLKVFPGFRGKFGLLYLLDISNCGLTEISNETFVGMHYITTLNLSDNSLTQIGHKAFSGLRHLMIIDLSRNQLHSLKPGVFSANTELTKVILSGNLFVHIPPSVFLYNSRLYHLDLSYNQLNTLWNVSESIEMKKHGIFGRLTFLNLAGNHLKKLYLHHFMSIEKLEKLDISENPIDCSTSFGHLMEWLIVNRVVPNRLNSPRPIAMENLNEEIANNIQWEGVIQSVCPTPEVTEPSDIDSNKEPLSIPSSPISPPTIDDHEDGEGRQPPSLVEVDPKIIHHGKFDKYSDQRIFPKEFESKSSDTSNSFYPKSEEPFVFSNTDADDSDYLVLFMIFCLFGFAVASLPVVVLYILRSRRGYRFTRFTGNVGFTPLDGHFPIRRGGRNVYHPLYKDCSVPNTPIVKGYGRKLNIVSVFSVPVNKQAPLDDV